MEQQIRLGLVLALIGISVLIGGCTNKYSIDTNSAQKISDSAGKFNNNLQDGDHFGHSLANLGDLNADGIIDLAAGAPNDDNGATDAGAVYILYLDTTGQVSSRQKISATVGNFNGTLKSGDYFGAAVTSLGDLNRDGFTDIVVGAPGDDDGGVDRGAVWILNLDFQGLVLGQHKISAVSGNLNVSLHDADQFGSAVSAIGDLDGDGVIDLAVGAPGDDDGGADRGAVWILFMNSDGTVKATQKISETTGNFAGLQDSNRFGSAIANMGDLDGDGVQDLVVGAPGDNDGGPARGAVWILFMNRDGTVKSSQKISQNQDLFDGVIGDGDQFGSAVTNLGDLNGDGIPDLGVGAPHNGDGGPDRGAIWVLFLRQDHSVISSSRISSTEGNFAGPLYDANEFGSSIVALGDLNRDGNPDIATGAKLDDDGGPDRGAVWVLFMNAVKTDVQAQDNTSLVDLFSGRGY